MTGSGKSCTSRSLFSSYHPPLEYRRVESELWWLERLRDDAVLAVPEVVPDRDGQGVVTVRGADDRPYLCTLFHWVPGRFYQHPSAAQLTKIGRLTALLHNHTTGLTVPPWFDRPVVDIADAPYTEKAVRLFRDRYSPDGAAVIAEALRRVRNAQEELAVEPGTFGLIHADIHQKNYLFNRGEARLIDFRDCGWGHYLYDLGVTIQQLGDVPDRARLQQALLDGYRQVRDLSSRHEGLIADFTLVREVQDLTWLVEEQDNPHYEKFSGRLERNLTRLAADLASLNIVQSPAP